ncbi:MAG: AraC family transcriptional regulator [Peptococcaceae bacterium]|nr:AraC family transcriptional regulator [Peptococcaceae bacterium]
MNGKDLFFSQQNMNLLCRDEACAVYQMKNETGEGTMTYYQVFPGIGVMYNDFHMAHCPSRTVEDNSHTFAIHHCREGRIETEVRNGAYMYLASGDIMLDGLSTENTHCSFPLSHYHGITVTISVPEAEAGLGELLSLFAIDLEATLRQFALATRPFIMHGNSAPDHVISELYQVPEDMRLAYLRVKVLELLVTLKTVDPTTLGVEHPYFYKTQVEKIKSIMAFMTASPERHFTMEELAQTFDISTSALKQCFKGVYGTAIYTYMRNYRMDLAASLLRQTDDSITVIAGKVGYANTSKFSEAFKKVKGQSPLAYRKIKI